MGFDFRNDKLRQAVELAELNPQKYNPYELAELTGLTYDQIVSGFRRAGKKHLLRSGRKQHRETSKLSERQEYIPPPPDTTNVLIIGDVHVPFDLPGYLEFCVEQYKRWNCTWVIFSGDLVDFYNFSRFERDPDALSPSDELDQVKEGIKRWYEAFPKADVCIGNHDIRVAKRAFSAGLPRRLIVSLQDLLDVPGWNFREKFYYDGIKYIHGDRGSAEGNMKKHLVSIVQGHMHPQAYVKWQQGETRNMFAMQIGCGIDARKVAFDYAKDQIVPVIGVGVILDHGKIPLNVLMP